MHKNTSNHQNLSYEIHKTKTLTIKSPNTISKSSTNAKLTIKKINKRRCNVRVIFVDYPYLTFSLLIS